MIEDLASDILSKIPLPFDTEVVQVSEISSLVHYTYTRKTTIARVLLPRASAAVKLLRGFSFCLLLFHLQLRGNFGKDV